MTFNKLTFAARLVVLRKCTKKRQQEVADELQISKGALGYYENAERLPNIEIAAKLASYYNVSVDYLLGVTNDPSPYGWNEEREKMLNMIDVCRKAAGVIVEITKDNDITDKRKEVE